MAINTGLFAQLNQAIGQSPMGGPAMQGLLDKTSQAAGGLAGNITGGDPMSFMGQRAKQMEAEKQVGLLDMSTAAGLGQAAEIYGKAGDVAKQVSFTQAAEAKQTSDLEKQRLQQTRESLAQRARAVGMDALGETILAGAHPDLTDAAETIRDMEKTDLLARKGAGARKGLAKAAGISEQEFTDLGLANVDAETFKAIIEGQEGDTKAYTDANGKPVMLRRSKYGRVWDKETRSWKNPSEMGLQQAPHLQKVHNVSNKLVEELAMKNVDTLTDLHERANNAQTQIDNIDRNLPLINAMPTGIGAPIELFIKQVGDFVGIPSEGVTNAEVFLADAGQRVMENIKAFGSGTGLSDADREYAKLISAGTISAKADALRRLLMIQRSSSQHTIDEFHKVKAETTSRLPEADRGVMSGFTVRSPMPNPSNDAGLSTSAQGYFK